MSDLAVVILTAPPAVEDPPGAMIKVDGRESVLRCMEMFSNRDGIVKTLVVIDPKQAEEVKRKLGSHLMFMGVKLVTGGETWWSQLAEAQKAIPPEAQHVLVHDGARPLVPYTDLDAILGMKGKKEVVALGQRVLGPVFKASKLPGTGWSFDQSVVSLLTPILFTRPSLDQAITEGRFPSPIEFIEGSALNVRVGTVDASFAKAMLGLLPKPKVKAPTNPFEEAQW